MSTIYIETQVNPRSSILVMHGLGASADDFVPFVEQLDLNSIGPVRFVFPQAPIIPITINGGYRMPGWYDIAVSDLGRMEDEVRLRNSQAVIDKLISREIAQGVPAERVVIGGFSQGGAVALMTGLRFPATLAGIVCMSGYLPLAHTAAAEQHAANAALPIFLAHGSRDRIVPIAKAHASHDALVKLGHPVEWRAYPMEHSVCPQEVTDLNRWLLRILSCK